MIEFRNVFLSFGDNVVLEGFNLKAELHEKIAILGGSGEGKTTILKLLLGLEMPDEGTVMVDGIDLSSLSESQLRKMRTKFSIVFQEGALFDSLSVRDNVAFSLRENSDLSEEEIEAKVREILVRVGIEEAIDLMPEELSGGMQRRVAIARSLVSCHPEMILYDEPTTGLDPLTADTTCALINDLSEGECTERRGLIIVTHRVTDAAKVAERFVYLKDGKIGFDGDITALRKTEDKELRKFINELLAMPEYNGRGV
jgi:phospholipid/cholesterol/gamma-HCH transport system ATP-binding protein